MLGQLFDESTILQNFSNLLNRFVIDKAIEVHGLETFGFDIYRIDGVVIDKDWTAVVNRFQKSVAKAFKQRRKCNQIGIGIYITQGIDLTSVLGDATFGVDDVSRKVDTHIEQFRIRPYVFFVFVALIATRMRYHQAGVASQPAEQFEGIFDAFALEGTRWLEKEMFIGINSQVRTKRSGVLIRWSRRVIKNHYVCDN